MGATFLATPGARREHPTSRRPLSPAFLRDELHMNFPAGRISESAVRQLRALAADLKLEEFSRAVARP